MQTTEGNRSRKIVVVAGFMLAVAVVLAALSNNPTRSLATLRRVDDYPLYVMHLYGEYDFDEFLQEGLRAKVPLDLPEQELGAAWACTVFAALNDEGDMLLGRNFDWHNRPTLLLFTHPRDGYASATLVDISYLGFDTEEPSWSERSRLLEAPFWTFDGMNEQGLAVGMMAVPNAQGSRDPQKVTVGSLQAMRLILDRAGSVEEALALLGEYNIDFGSGPPLHYLIADSAGNSVVLEFIAGETKVLRNEEPWQVATNFVISGTSPGRARALCDRYATASESLEAAEGRVLQEEAMDLLADVSQPLTVWSVVYNLTSGDISVAMGRGYDEVHHFTLDVRAR